MILLTDVNYRLHQAWFIVWFFRLSVITNNKQTIYLEDEGFFYTSIYISFLWLNVSIYLNLCYYLTALNSLLPIPYGYIVCMRLVDNWFKWLECKQISYRIQIWLVQAISNYGWVCSRLLTYFHYINEIIMTDRQIQL
jgi:hypothetical protein